MINPAEEESHLSAQQDAKANLRRAAGIASTEPKAVARVKALTRPQSSIKLSN
jgi:hypothetical protein